ncbi:hypothetical protein JW868_04605 [Candidatus Woesearchaeota archaeon]|nr:hypothetical protein [Candidatus Woesearchaeota archaeon]
MKKILIGVTAVLLVLSLGFVSAYGPMFASQEQADEFRAEVQAHQETVQAAIGAGNYNAWREAMADRPQPPRMEDLITEDNWNTFVEMQNAMKDGYFEKAQELREELGIQFGGFGNRFGKGHRGLGERGQHNFADCPMMQE